MPSALLKALRADLIAMLAPVALPLQIDRTARPFVVLTVGVNGVGKTTTIGKLARRFKEEGHSLMLAAGDTFRAAAVAQLQTWGERNGVPVIAQGQDADAASVAFDALQAAKARGIEVLIADTAGRLHTQQGLMAELGKIRRVLGKLDADRAARSADGDRRHHRAERACRSCASSMPRSASPAWWSPSSTAPPRAAWCSRWRASSAFRSATPASANAPRTCACSMPRPSSMRCCRKRWARDAAAGTA